MSLGVEVSKSLVAKVIGAGFGFVGTIIFARALGPTDFGGYYLLLSLVQLAERPASGIENASRKRYSEIDSPRDELLGVQFGFNLASVLAVGAILVALRPYLVSYTGLEFAAVLFVLLYITRVTFSSLQSFLNAVGKLGLQTWIDTARSVVTFGFQLGLVLLGLGATGMALGLAGATFLSSGVTYYWIRRVPSLPTRSTLRSVWRFARYSTVSALVGKAYDRFDVLLLGLLATPAVAAYYEVAYKLTVPAMFVGGLVSSGLMVKVSDLHSQGESVATDITNTTAFASLFSVPIFFGALAISETVIVTAYGADYEAAAALLVGLALYRVLQTQTAVMVSAVNGLDLPEMEVRASVAALTLNVVLGVALYFQFGAIGVVIATVVAEALRYLVLSSVVASRTDARLVPRLLLHQLFAGVLLFAVVTVARDHISVRSWVEFVFLLLLGGSVYFVALTGLSHHFRLTVRSIVDELVAGSRLD